MALTKGGCMNKIEIKYKKVEDLIPYVNNSRTHSDDQVFQIASSMKEFGWTNPILLDGENGIIAGHGRLMAAKKLNQIEVPTIELAGLTDIQKKAYIIADNKLALNAGWNDEILKLEIAELKNAGFDLGLTGFNIDELKTFDPIIEGLVDEDQVPDVPEEPKTKLGDIYKLGNHRLMCGDSTSIDAVDKLMNGVKADVVFTDPPYGMFLDTNYDSMFANDKSHKKTGNRFDLVKGDHDDFNPEFINIIFAAFSYCKEIFLWGADYYIDLIPNRNDGSWVVWDKRCNENMDKVVGNTFELCWSKAKHKRMVARIMWSGHHGMAKDDTRKRVHPTQKPVELISWFFDYYSMADKKTIVDLFGGSGSTLIAAEKSNKNAYLMELDPKYCDVIVKRWEDFTGQKAELLNE
jgi:DNA modification methylase